MIEKTYKKIPMKLDQLVYSYITSNMKYDSSLDYLGRGIYHRFHLRLHKHHLETLTYSHPINAFEMIKEKYFPKWLLNYFPVKYKSITLKADAFYPKLAFPQEESLILMDIEVEEIDGNSKKC